MKNKFFRWLSIWLSVPRSCCHSSELPGGEIMGAKIIAKKPWDFGSFILWVILHRIGEKSSIWLFVPRLICTLIRKFQASCKIYPIFSGWQKHLIFSRVATWKKAGFHKVNRKKNECHALENLRCFCHPDKNRVHFTRYPSNHFSECKLKGRLS